VTLDDLDARAALQRRVDTKYLISWERMAELLPRLREDHEALEIEGRRSFAYENVYFDTPELRCFHDHVEHRLPRFKVRSRLYADAGQCSFEVKVKREDDETDKEQMDVDPGDHGRMTPKAERFVRTQLSRSIGSAPEGLAPALATRFRRFTVAADNQRVTFDHGVELDSLRNGSVRLADDCVIVETKTEDGEGLCNRLLEEAGVDAVSLSKYRVGIGLLLAEDPEPQLGERRERVFRREG
jgi:hypothetical protein